MDWHLILEAWKHDFFDSLRSKYARLETKYIKAFEKVAELNDKELDDLLKYPSTHNLQENLPRLVEELKEHRLKIAKLKYIFGDGDSVATDHE